MEVKVEAFLHLWKSVLVVVAWRNCLRTAPMSTAGILAGVFLLLALYSGLDPFQLSPLQGFPDFKAYRADLPPWSQLTSAHDPESKLQRAEVRFLNQVQGPESVAFDPRGRGPYTGVADGRILFWNGESWTDFAYTSSNRCFSFSFCSVLCFFGSRF